MKNLFTLANMHSVFLSRQFLIHCHYEPFFQIGTLFFLITLLCFFLQKSGEIHDGIGPYSAIAYTDIVLVHDLPALIRAVKLLLLNNWLCNWQLQVRMTSVLL
jgi:hypothetical protein